MRARRYFLIAAAIVTLTIVGRLTVSHAEAATSPQIVVQNFMFTPTSLKIKAGSTVTWINKDDEPHTVFSDKGLFRSGALDTNEQFSYKFDQPGTYRYLCTIHPQMLGTIVVE